MENEHNLLLEAYKDLKAEFVAASLLEQALSPEKILFRPLGAFKRRSHSDIEETSEQEVGNFKGKVIESNRSGIYDYLPEQLFHLPSSKTGKTLKRKVDEIREQREKERKTRLFFLPLEQEFFHNKVLIGQIEQRASELSPVSLLFEELRYFWQIPDFVANATFVRLLPVLPAMSESRSDLPEIEQILSKILNISVKIESEFGRNLADVTGAEIGSAKLGVDLLLGGKIDSYLPELQINLSLKSIFELENCLDDRNFDSLVKWLLGWLLPVEYEYAVNLRVTGDGANLHLEDSILPLSRLGYSSILA